MLQFQFQSQMSRPSWFEFTTAILGLMRKRASPCLQLCTVGSYQLLLTYVLTLCQCCRSHCCSKSLKQYRKICIWICAWNNYVSYILVCVHFIVCSMYVSSCSTPSFSGPSFSSPANSSHANSAIPFLQTRSYDENSVRLSVYLSNFALWQNERKISPDFYNIRNIIYPSFLRKKNRPWGRPLVP